MDIEFLRTLGAYFFVCSGISLVLAAVLLALTARSVRKVDIPEHADFFETLYYTPIGIVLMIDLLDFALDIFATPIVWIVLDWLGLKALRNAASAEALIPFTGPLPIFTLSWIAVRLFGMRW